MWRTDERERHGAPPPGTAVKTRHPRGRSLLQKALADTLRTGGDDCQVCITVDVVHMTDLVQLVVVRVLDNAEAINPEPAEPQHVCYVDCIADGRGKMFGGDTLCVRGYVCVRGLVDLVFSPHVAQREELPASSGC